MTDLSRAERITQPRDWQPPADEGRSTQYADPAAARSLRPHLIRSAVFLTIVSTFLLFWAVGMTFSTLAGMSQLGVHTLDLGPTLDTGLSLVGLAGTAFFGLLWLISLTTAIREFVAEDATLVVHAAESRPAVFDSICALVNDRCPPFTARVDESDGDPTLHVTNDEEWAVLIVQKMGPDLHISWSMWRTRSTTALVSRVIFKSREDAPQLLRANSCSALQEVLRNAVRESVRANTR